MQAIASAGMPCTMMPEGRAEREGDLGAHQHSGFQSASRRRLSDSARNTMEGCDAAPPGGARGREATAGNLADRPITLSTVRRVARQRLETRTHDLVEDLDPARLSVHAHDGQRPRASGSAHRTTGAQSCPVSPQRRTSAPAAGSRTAGRELLLESSSRLDEDRARWSRPPHTILAPPRRCAPARCARWWRHRHANRHAVRDLFADHRLRAVGDSP